LAKVPETRSKAAIKQASYRARQKAKPSVAQDKNPKGLFVSHSELAYSVRRKRAKTPTTPWVLPKPAPGVLPEASVKFAMDEVGSFGAISGWAGNYYNMAFTEGLQFLGYPYLAELAQRAEYRRPVEIIATEMTRKWIRLHATGDEDKSDKIQAIEAEMDRLGVQAAFKKIAEHDGFFGRAHLYLDTGATDDTEELLTPIGDGQSDLSKKKVGKGGLKGLRAVEAVWTYPTNYNSNDPLKPDWYKPDTWFVMGKRIHSSRLLTFIGRPVPDLLKPAYSFGGLALTQMGKPYVDNWLETRQSVNDAISAYSVFVLGTNMEQTLQVGGGALDRRVEAFNNYRNNRGTMLIDKDLETLENVSAPLGSLDLLQAQAQEHQATPFGIPLVKLFGETPSGLNASSDGEMRCFYDWIGAYQSAFYEVNLRTVIGFIQLSLFGQVDEEITFEFEPLWELNEKEKAEVEKIEAETAQIRIDSGVIAPAEERLRVASQPDTPYHGLDPDDAPDLSEEEHQGLVVRGEKGEGSSEGD
jgi:phage-related protein (TIGR01555 family)